MTKTIDPHAAAVALGRLGGLAKSAKKAEAVRKNGKKGGRPRKAKIAIDTNPRQA